MYLDQITNDELADVGRLTEMTIRAGMTVMRTVTQYKERQMAELTAELKEYRLANPLLPKGDISDLSYFWASDSLPKQTVQELPGQIKERMEALQAMNLYIQIRLQGENPLTPAPKKAATQPPLFGSFWGQKEQSLALNKAVVQVEQ